MLPMSYEVVAFARDLEGQMVVCMVPMLAGPVPLLEALHSVIMPNCSKFMIVNTTIDGHVGDEVSNIDDDDDDDE
jgi:hypothetical protein